MKRSSIMMGALMGLTLTATSTLAVVDGFTDVPSDHWAATAIANLKASGVVKGYADNTFKPNAPVSRAEVSVMLDNNNQQWMKKIEAMSKEMSEIKTMVEGETLPGKQSDLAMTELEVELDGGKTLSEINMPALTLPAGIDKGQIRKYFQIGDLRLALVLQGSMNIPLQVPDGFKTTFGGMLIAGKTDTAWSKFLTLKDTSENNNDGSTGNDPYYLWTDAKKLMLSVIDQNGGGSGEGVEKVYSTLEGEAWHLEGCYYFGPSDSNSNWGADVDASGDALKYSKNLSEQGVLSAEQMTACENDVTLTPHY